MDKTYKIWASIEKCVDGNDDQTEDVYGPEFLGEFDTEEEARAHFEEMERVGLEPQPEISVKLLDGEESPRAQAFEVFKAMVAGCYADPQMGKVNFRGLAEKATEAVEAFNLAADAAWPDSGKARR